MAPGRSALGFVERRLVDAAGIFATGQKAEATGMARRAAAKIFMVNTINSMESINRTMFSNYCEFKKCEQQKHTLESYFNKLLVRRLQQSYDFQDATSTSDGILWGVLVTPNSCFALLWCGDLASSS